MRSYAYNVRRYFRFNVSEIKSLTLTILFLAFIVAFNDGSEAFNLQHWISNFLLWFIIVTISVLVKQTGHRLMGIFYGFRVEYRLWWYGLIISIAIAFVTRGHIWLLIPGGIMIYHMSVHRIGWFRYGPNMKAFSVISIAGPLALILFGTIIKNLELYTPLLPLGSLLVHKVFVFTLAFAAFSMLPIPPLDGSRVMFDSRLIYAFSAGSIAGYAVLAYLNIYSWFFALIIGVIIWFSYYFFFERKL